MKRRLITLLMVVAMLASVAMIASAERLLVDDEVELGAFTWENSDNQMGWKNDVMYVREPNDSGDPAESTITMANFVKASHLVLELSGVPTGDMQLVWQTNVIPGWDWYQSDIPLADIEAMLDGTTLTIPLPYYLANYFGFFGIALRTEPGMFEAEGGTYGALLTDEEINTEVSEIKLLVAYWDSPVADLVTGAKLTYGPVGAHPNPAATYEMPEPGTAMGKISWSTQFAQASGDATTGVTLRKDVLVSSRGITLVVDADVFDESEIILGMQSMDAWDGGEQWKPVSYTYTVEDGVGYVDVFFSAFAGGGGWDHFKDPENLHGKFVFQTDSGSLEKAFQSAYLWWTMPERGDVEEVTEPAGDDDTEPAGDDGETPTEAPATPAPASTDDEGGSAILWILIAGAAVVVIIIIIVVVSKGKKK